MALQAHPVKMAAGDTTVGSTPYGEVGLGVRAKRKGSGRNVDIHPQNKIDLSNLLIYLVFFERMSNISSLKLS